MLRLPNWSRRRRRHEGATVARRRDRLGLRPEVRALEGRLLLTTIEVTTTAGDGSPGSLVAAISAADRSSDPPTIVFDPNVFDTPQTIHVKDLPLLLFNNGPITIVGPGANLLTVSADGQDRVMEDYDTTASISGLTLTDGNGEGGELDGSIGDGGAFCNDGGDVTLTDCTFSDSSSFDSGGGVCNYLGNLDMVDCTVTGNAATWAGGGVANYSTMEMTGCTVSDNSTYSYRIGRPYGGGGVSNSDDFDPFRQPDAQMTLTNCTITGNTAGGLGGGLDNPQGGAVAIYGCTFSDNIGCQATYFMYPQGDAGGLANQGDMSVSGSTFSNNSQGIANGYGTIDLTDCTISGSTVNGGMLNLRGNAYLTGCTFSGNYAYDDGGGLYAGGNINDVVDCTFVDNIGFLGGGVAGGATLTDCTIAGNSALNGGGLYGSFLMDDCAIVGNTASGHGGGLADYADSVLDNCTIADNTAGTNGGGVDNVLPNYSGRLTLVACTVTGNSAATGSGIYGAFQTPIYPQYAYNYASQTTLDDTIVAGNSGGDLAGGGTFLGSSNLIGTDPMGHFTDGVDGNLVGVINPGLGPLGIYGGPTETIPLLPGSPALDAGNNTLDVDPNGNPLTTDQRGLPRVVNGSVDIGAFESSGFVITPTSGPQSTLIDTAFLDPLSVEVTPVHPGDPVAGGIVTFTAPSSGPSAILSAGSATISSAGVASVSATANGEEGFYVVVPSTAGGQLLDGDDFDGSTGILLVNIEATVVSISIDTGPSGPPTPVSGGTLIPPPGGLGGDFALPGGPATTPVDDADPGPLALGASTAAWTPDAPTATVEAHDLALEGDISLGIPTPRPRAANFRFVLDNDAIAVRDPAAAWIKTVGTKLTSS